MKQFSVREADISEKEGFARLFWKVFEPELPFEDVLKKDLVDDWNRNDLQEWAYIAEMDGMIRSNVCFSVSEDCVIRSNSLKIGGIWAIATEKPYRKMGMCSSILKMIFNRMRNDGIVVSMVNPDKNLFAFYERYGYGFFESAKLYELNPDSLRTVKGDPGISHREMEDKNEWNKILQIQKAMSRYGSRLCAPRRHLEYVIESGHCHLLERDSAPVGVVKLSFAKAGDRTWLNIWPATCYASLDVFSSILSIIQEHAIKADRIRWFCGAESPVLHYTQGPQIVVAKDWGNMMMRVVDFVKFCKSIDVPKSAIDKCIIQLVDEYCPWNEGTYMISPSDGKLDIEHTKKEPEVVLDSTNLSRMVGGFTISTMLHGLNEIDCSLETAEKLEAIFPSDPFFSHYRF
ncbi:MAG: GNAT family N-acetyltransferase [Candidatus Thorarchaeota archaeon]|jgi:predicted acetyltransferase